jgi:hypothetical protein
MTDRGKKFCLWLGKDAGGNDCVVRHGLFRRNESTPAEPGLPVMIVSFKEDGSFEQADVYFPEGGWASVNTRYAHVVSREVGKVEVVGIEIVDTDEAKA